jgi:hypothetical protein
MMVLVCLVVEEGFEPSATRLSTEALAIRTLYL